MLDILDHIPDGFLISSFSRSREAQLRDSHSHDFHELYFLNRGTARHFIENEVVHIQSGDFVFIKKGLIHKTMYSPGTATERLMLCFTDEFLGDEFRDILENLGRQKYLQMPPIINLKMEELVQRIHSEYQQKPSCYLEMCKCLVKELIITLYRQSEHKPKTSLSNVEYTIQDAAKYITENFYEDITLAGLSKKYAMSQGHFSRTFKAVTGFGVSEYITAIRIDNAEKLLKKGQYTVTEVAEKCGFSDSNYFSSVFRNKKGVTPRRYALMFAKDP